MTLFRSSDSPRDQGTDSAPHRFATTIARAGLLLLSLSWLSCSAEPYVPPSAEDPVSPARLERRTYASPTTGGDREYYIYLPAGYDDDGEDWPVLLFLHGGGERGDTVEDLDYVLALGPLYEAWIRKRDLPFLIVSPQLPLFGREKIDSYLQDRDPAKIPRRLDEGVPPRPPEFPTRRRMRGAPAAPDLPYGASGLPEGWPRIEEDLLLILDRTLGEDRADGNRVYLTGVSYGGFGVWYLGSRHADRFAAIAPVVGWGHPDLMPSIAESQLPLWAFAGGRDRGNQTRHFYPGLNALERLGHRDVRFTIHSDMGHDVWARVYAGRDLYDWFLSHEQEVGAP